MAPTQPRDAPSSIPLSEHSLTTPLRHSLFESELANHPDKGWVSWLTSGIRNGVHIGYTGSRCSLRAKNLRSAYLHPGVIQAELTKELAAGRMAGPYPTLSIPNVRCAGLGVVPKKGGKWRMIMHLSAPRGHSINDAIPKERYSLQYSSVDDAVALLFQAGRGALMAKVDLKSAFRMVPVRRADWRLLGVEWDNQIYLDKCLPFGLRSAPYLFNQVAQALSWIMRENYGIKSHIHYLDDYFLVGPAASDQCATQVATMLNLCTRLGIPVATDKLEGPATTITFLGIQIDSVSQELSLPADKLSDLMLLTGEWCQKTKCTKRQLLSLIGKLAFAAKVAPAGRFFLRRLIDLSCTVQRLHHHIHLNTDTRADIRWWYDFLPSWNGKALFLESSWTSNESLSLYTDASGSHGYGAYYHGAWLRADWLPHQSSHDIQWKELYAIVIAVITWGHNWTGKRIRFNCDNKSIVQSWAKGSSKNRAVMSLLRHLFLVAARGQFTISMAHIPGSRNTVADALSRNKMVLFHNLSPQADPEPTPVPTQLMPDPAPV